MSTQDIWAQALKESESPELRNPSLWAQCLVKADGDEAKARAIYIKTKVEQASNDADALADPAQERKAPLSGTETTCKRCMKPIRKTAINCPHCGALTTPYTPPPPVPQQSRPQPEKKSNWWKWVLGVPVGGFALVMIVGSCAGNTPEGKERSNSRLAIEMCWREQNRKSLDPSTARFAASACERMEADFRNKWGYNP